MSEPRYTSVDMYKAWAAGFAWCAQGVGFEDGELFIPEDEPGVEGRDHGEAFGSWIEDYDTERDADGSLPKGIYASDRECGVIWPEEQIVGGGAGSPSGGSGRKSSSQADHSNTSVRPPPTPHIDDDCLEAS